MTGEVFPQPFDETYQEPSLKERMEVRDLFDAAVAELMSKHVSLLEHSETEMSGIVTERNDLELISLDDHEEAVEVVVSTLKTWLIQTNIVQLIWMTGAKKDDSSVYLTDMDSANIVRRDIPAMEREMMSRRAEEILGVPLMDVADKERLRDMAHQVSAEGEDNRELERNLGFNIQPIHVNEMEWLKGILAVARP